MKDGLKIGIVVFAALIILGAIGLWGNEPKQEDKSVSHSVSDSDITLHRTVDFAEEKSKASAAAALPQTTAEVTTEKTTAKTEKTSDAEAETPVRQAEQNGEYEFVANVNSGKFHYSWCDSVNKMKEENKAYYYCPAEEMLENGFEPCARCNP